MRTHHAITDQTTRPRFLPQKLRVLMTADTVGGVWTYALDLARALESAGAHVDLATMGAPLSAEQQRDADAVCNLTVYPSLYKLEWMEDPWADVDAAGHWLLDLEEQLRPDIVHLNGYAHGALPFQAPILMVGHSCVSSWWRAVKGQDAPDCQRYVDAVRQGLQEADLVVAPTQAMLSSLNHHYGPLPCSEVVYNGRDGRLFVPRSKERFILTAGRLWDEAKNTAALERAAASIGWPIYVAGEAQHPSQGCNAAIEGLKPLGHLAPRELAGWFGRAAIYALPARYEPFGLSALEAALSGCALVLGDIPSLREVWGDAAQFVAPDDDGALQAALQALIANPARRAALARRARIRARRYGLEQMAAGYLQAYAALLPTEHQQRGRNL